MMYNLRINLILRPFMRIKTIIFAVASTLSFSAIADNDSNEIEKAIRLLEQKGYQIDSPNETKKSPPVGISLKSSQTGNVDAFISGDFGRTRYNNNNNFYDSGDNFLNNKITDSSYNVRASFAYQDPSKFGAQFDAVYSQENIKGAKLSNVDLAGHAFYRSDKYLVGLFGQYKQPSFHRSSTGNDDGYSSYTDVVGKILSPDQLFFGAEAQGYFGDLTLTGQLAHQKFINQSDYSNDGMFKDGTVATVKANYFIKDNWKVNAGYAYNTADMSVYWGDTSSGASYVNQIFSIGTEYRLSSFPVSIYGDYNHNKFNFDINCVDCGDITNPKYKSDTIMAGLKYNFGSDSLKSRDRSGASLDPIKTKGFSEFLGTIFGRDNTYPD